MEKRRRRRRGGWGGEVGGGRKTGKASRVVLFVQCLLYNRVHTVALLSSSNSMEICIYTRAARETDERTPTARSTGGAGAVGFM